MKRWFFIFSMIIIIILSACVQEAEVATTELMTETPTVTPTTSPEPTPTMIPNSTYDPFAEPILPENYSEFELGQNRYWQNCMTCQGELGQGLTDEFRAYWPEDHQNCWGRGCHGGGVDDQGFPIPTYVPPLVTDTKMVRFYSQQDLYTYLKTTHPPQDPGVLEDEEYIAIANYVFIMNDRPLREDIP
jgi:hypothetical protein